MSGRTFDDIKTNIGERTIDLPEVGQAMLTEMNTSDPRLQYFYTNNYRPNYILKDQTLFDWQFLNNDKKVVVLKKDDEIIAHHGIIPVVFTDGAGEYAGFVSTNVMVAEAYRRKGIMSVVMDALHERYDAGSNMGASEMGTKFYQKMGYETAGRLERCIAVLDPKKCIGASKHPEHLQRTVSELSQRVHEGVRAIGDFSSIDAQIEGLWNQAFPPGTSFGIKRSGEFLHWRYDIHPYFEYKKYAIWQGDELRGVIVFRIEPVRETNTFVIRIVEAFGFPEDMKALIASTVLHKDVSSGAAWIDWSCPSAKINDVFISLGFVPLERLAPSVIPVLCNPVDYYKVDYLFMIWIKDVALKNQLPPFDTWYITKGDGDADRPNVVG